MLNENTSTRICVLIESTRDQEMQDLGRILAEVSEENVWESGPTLEWYGGDEETEAYYYFQWGEIEVPVRENVRYEFLRETGELVGEFPV